MDALLARAYRAYFMTAKKEQYQAPQPSEGRSGEEGCDDKNYIVLRNGYGILAVYRVRNDDVLKRLRRWPAGLGTTSDGKCHDDWRYTSLAKNRARRKK